MNPITRNDLLRPMFALRPLWVALIVWSAGWGSLLLIAWSQNAIYAGLLRDPGHMIGDVIMLPLAGLLITQFYQSVAEPHSAAVSRSITNIALLGSVSTTIGVTYYSIFVSGNYQGGWSVPHTAFIWFFAYVLMTFLIKGALQLSGHSSPRLYATYSGVVLAVAAHLILKLAVLGA